MNRFLSLNEYALGIYRYTKDLYNYAFKNGEFPAGTATARYCSTDPRNSYMYARDVLEGRFELGEHIISKEAWFSYLYAKDVIKGRFELGEAVLAVHADYSYYYARNVIKGRFELGEAAIATNGQTSYDYARYAIKGRFELGEEAILNSIYAKYYIDDYITDEECILLKMKYAKL